MEIKVGRFPRWRGCAARAILNRPVAAFYSLPAFSKENESIRTALRQAPAPANPLTKLRQRLATLRQPLATLRQPLTTLRQTLTTIPQTFPTLRQTLTTIRQTFPTLRQCFPTLREPLTTFRQSLRRLLTAARCITPTTCRAM